MSPAAHARAEGEEKGRNVKAEQTRMRVACLTRASYMEASTDAEGDATIGDRTEHFCREAQGGGGFARVWVLCLRARARGTNARQTGAPLSGHPGNSAAVCVLIFSHSPCGRMIRLHPSPARYPRATRNANRAEDHRKSTTSHARRMGANSR